MGSNRQYTGLERTPASMSWLIRQRSVIQGAIDKCEHQLRVLPETLKGLREELKAIDAVIPRHQVKVDPLAIKGTRPYPPRLAPLGAATKHILRRLREANGQKVTSISLALSFAEAYGIDVTNRAARADVVRRIRYRLKALANQGLVQRHHSSKTNDAGVWSLAGDVQGDHAHDHPEVAVN